MSDITDQIKAWLPRGIAASDLLPLEQRLRTTAEALREMAASSHPPPRTGPEEPEGRERYLLARRTTNIILAQLEQEGLT